MLKDEKYRVSGLRGETVFKSVLNFKIINYLFSVDAFVKTWEILVLELLFYTAGDFELFKTQTFQRSFFVS